MDGHSKLFLAIEERKRFLQSMSSSVEGSTSSGSQKMPPSSSLVLGIMSGTSLDGVDLCLARMRGTGPGTAPHSLRIEEIEHFKTVDMPPDLASLIRRAMGKHDAAGSVGTSTAHAICQLNTEWSRQVARMCNEFIDEWKQKRRNVGVDDNIIIASHGQTVWHISGDSTLQVGDGEILAQLTGRVVISNFRASDVAVGGTGAPLVPYFDKILATCMIAPPPVKNRLGGHPMKGESQGLERLEPLQFPVALQNLGGIGNVCFVEKAHPTSSASGDVHVQAFDTGPANVILNELIEQFLEMATSANAKEGTTNTSLLRSFLEVIVAMHEHKETRPPEGDGCCNEDTTSATLSEVKELLQKNETRPHQEDQLTALLSTCDVNSLYSSLGQVDEELLSQWMRHPFIIKKPPKSTGREDFGVQFVQDLLKAEVAAGRIQPDVTAADVIQRFCDLCRTAVEFTCATIVEAYATFFQPAASSSSKFPHTIILCGGGSHHPLMRSRINDLAQQCTSTTAATNDNNTNRGGSCHVMSFSEVHLEGLQETDVAQSTMLADCKEALAFAVFGHEKLMAMAISSMSLERDRSRCLPPIPTTNVPAVTGASKCVTLGQVSIPN